MHRPIYNKGSYIPYVQYVHLSTTTHLYRSIKHIMPVLVLMMLFLPPLWSSYHFSTFVLLCAPHPQRTFLPYMSHLLPDTSSPSSCLCPTITKVYTRKGHMLHFSLNTGVSPKSSLAPPTTPLFDDIALVKRRKCYPPQFYSRVIPCLLR